MATPSLAKGAGAHKLQGLFYKGLVMANEEQLEILKLHGHEMINVG